MLQASGRRQGTLKVTNNVVYSEPQMIEQVEDGPHDPGMEARVAALETSTEIVKATLGRVEPKLDKLDDRVRTLEITVGKIDGKLDLLVAKMPSWWQQPAGVAVVIAALAGAIALGKSLGVLH